MIPSPRIDEAVAQLVDDAKKKNKQIMADDPVEHPSHYAMEGQIECIEAIEASMTDEAFLGFLKGNVEKYIWRYEKKINPLEDLKKARWYLNKLIEKETIYKSEGEGNEGKN